MITSNGLAAAMLLGGSGCVSRVMHVRSDPPGAAVWLNDRQVGRTPFDKEFLWYGNYDVVVRADGYETLKTNRGLTAPWWQWVPFDLLTDFLPVRDDQTIQLKLKPQGPPDPAGTLARGEQMRLELESSGFTTHKNVLAIRPAAKPSTAPTTEPADEP
jgi:hypothetical protein